MTAPELSVVMPTDSLESIRRWLGYMEAQTALERIELVIVAPPGAELVLDGIPGYAAVRVVEAPIDVLPRARLRGLREASAPVVVFTETHSYPDPGWADALIRAHRAPWAAVGPVVGNANPDSALSWACFLLDYGHWAEPLEGTEVEHLPGHNSSYKRELLLDPELEPLLDAESVLHWRLRSQGSRLYVEPAARIAHLNVTVLSSWPVERFYAARVFAATRARGWPPRRRALYAAGSLLIPFVRLPRVLGDSKRTDRPPLLPRFLPLLVASLVLSAAGELVGYAGGARGSLERLLDMELHRERHVA